ncbi:MAG: outer membrane beta-barrel protein [Terriglobales bacterium]|jgi:opacity protein-like surface antigen
MRKLVLAALAAIFFLGVSFAQSIPIEVFGGYSYYSLDLPANPSSGSTATRLGLNGWDASLSIFRWHHLSAEGDVSGHTTSNCDDTSVSCSNFSYMFGPRYNLRQGSKMTIFVHGLVGQDRATLSYNGFSQNDTSLSFAAGAGVDYWLFRHIGIQLGPADYVYTRHLQSLEGEPSQANFRASAGVVFRFGGESGGERAPKATRASASKPSTTAGVRQAPQPSANVPGHGMAIAALGLAVGPQEFDGAKILEVDPGGVGEMASMKAGDLIKSVDGKPIRTPMELLAELSDKSGKVKIGIQRGDFATETVILLGAH